MQAATMVTIAGKWSRRMAINTDLLVSSAPVTRLPNTELPLTETADHPKELPTLPWDLL